MKLLRVVLWSVLGLIGTVVVTAFAIVIRPQLILNEPMLKLAAYFAARQGVHISWKQMDIEVDSLALLRKKVWVDVHGLCVEIQDQGVSGCGSKVQFSLAASFSDLVPRLTEVGPVDVSNFRWQLGDGGKKTQGVLNLEGKGAQTNELKPYEKWNLRVWGRALLPDRSKVKLNALGNLSGVGTQEMELGYSLSADYSQRDLQVSSQLEGHANQNEVRSKISAKITGLSESVPQVVLRDCEANLKNEGRLRLNCPLKVTVPVPPESLEPLKIPTQLGAIVKANLKTSDFIPSPETSFSGPVEVELDPLLTPLFQGRGEVLAHVEGSLADFPEHWKVRSKAQFKVRVPKFENLVARLRPGPWAVPAPFNALGGSVNFELQGESDLHTGQFPVVFKTRLASEAQTVKLDGKGILYLNQIMKGVEAYSGFELILSDLKLELPRLNWSAPPQLLPDPRFKHTPTLVHQEEEGNNSKFYYRFRVLTKPGHPIKLLSNLAQAPIPVELDITLSDSAPLGGIIQIGRFPIEIFRRQATVEHFLLKLSSPTGESPVDGAVQVSYADYTVTIRILSTFDKPEIKLSSEPSLPHDQLMAVLLFGYPLEELDPVQSASVGNTRAALESQAIGLASLYALASTPIQSIGFDPATGTWSAKVRLGEGTSLNLGTGAEGPSVGIRKRLGGFWTIVTDLTRSPETGQVASAYLEWSHRY